MSQHIELGTFHGIPYYCEPTVSRHFPMPTLSEFFQIEPIPTAEGQTKKSFHFINRRRKNFYAEVTIEKVRKSANQVICIIKEVKLTSHEQALRDYVGVPETEEEFIRSLPCSATIEEEVADPDDSKEEEDAQILETSFRLREDGLETILSAEMQANVLGRRGEDHHLSTKIIHDCVLKKEKQLQALKAKEKATFYFRTSNGKILAMVFCKSPDGKRVFALTGYYKAENVFQQETNLSEERLKSWKATLPLIKIQN